MSLVFAERKVLADSLRRYVRTATEYDDADKMMLLHLLDKFERWGINLIEPADRPTFLRLIEHACTI